MLERPDRSPQRNALRSSRPTQSALHRTTSHASHHAPCGPLGPLPGPLDSGPGCPHIPQSLQLCPHWSYWYYLVRHSVRVSIEAATQPSAAAAPRRSLALSDKGCAHPMVPPSPPRPRVAPNRAILLRFTPGFELAVSSEKRNHYAAVHDRPLRSGGRFHTSRASRPGAFCPGRHEAHTPAPWNTHCSSGAHLLRLPTYDRIAHSRRWETWIQTPLPGGIVGKIFFGCAAN